MAEDTTTPKKKKPSFLRRDWYKKIKFGKGVKKNQKWRAAKGRQNKTRLGRRGYGARPKVGYGADNETKHQVKGHDAVTINNVSELEKIKSGQGILIANVGLKKRKEIIAKANEKKLIILNKYMENKK